MKQGAWKGFSDKIAAFSNSVMCKEGIASTTEG